MDETYVKVKGVWKYLYCAVDKAGDTVDFSLRVHRDKAAARRFFEQAIERSGAPDKVTIDKSGSNVAALEAINAGREKPIVVCAGRQVKYGTTSSSQITEPLNAEPDRCSASRIFAAPASFSPALSSCTWSEKNK